MISMSTSTLDKPDSLQLIVVMAPMITIVMDWKANIALKVALVIGGLFAD
jgi:hypothetical protein